MSQQSQLQYSVVRREFFSRLLKNTQTKRVNYNNQMTHIQIACQKLLFLVFWSSHTETESGSGPVRARVFHHKLKVGLCQPNGYRINGNQVFHYIFMLFFKNGWKQRLFKSVETFRDYTTKNSKLFLLLAFLSKVTAYRVKSHLNRVLSYLSLSIKTSVVLCEYIVYITKISVGLMFLVSFFS